VSRAANDAFAGRMRPAGREFETPGLKEYYPKGYNFAGGGQLTSASVPRLHWWQLW